MVRKIWEEQEVLVGVDGQPFAVKAGLPRRLEEARMVQDRIKRGNAKRDVVAVQINRDSLIPIKSSSQEEKDYDLAGNPVSQSTSGKRKPAGWGS